MSPDNLQPLIRVDRPDRPRIHQVATLMLDDIVVTRNFVVTNNPAMTDRDSTLVIAEHADGLIRTARRKYGSRSKRFFRTVRTVHACTDAANKPISELVLGETPDAA